MKKPRDTAGLTLVEMLVAMTIFLAIMTVTAASYRTIVNHSSQQSKSAETFSAGIVGLEVLRSDLKQIGFGLPWSFQSAPAYSEARAVSNNQPAAGFWPTSAPPAPASYWVNSFNDAPDGVPRAIQSANTLFNQYSGVGSKYLVLKSTLVGASPAARKWTTVSFAGGEHSKKVWGEPGRDLNPGSDRVVVVQNLLNGVPPTRQLMVGGAGQFFTTFGSYSTLTQPHQDGDSFEVYGVDGNDLIMPFNRADYYVMTPPTGSGSAGMPSDCAPHTGVLYKATLNHVGGSFTQTPLLDCVADLQVVYGLDTSGAGFINSHTVSPLSTPQNIRSQLREVRVYLLAQEGKMDRGFSYPYRTVTVGERFGGVLQGRNFNLQALIGSGWQNYRWKVYTIVVYPRNLSQ